MEMMQEQREDLTPHPPVNHYLFMTNAFTVAENWIKNTFSLVQTKWNNKNNNELQMI